MKRYTDAFKDIPGTVVFDATQSRLGYHLNMFCMSLMKAENRDAFKADERTYLARFPMTEAQRQAVLDRDYNRMLALGGNIYFLAKIGATDGFSFQNLASKMTGMTEADYMAMMVGGGRSPEVNPRLSAGTDAGPSAAGSPRADGGLQRGDDCSPQGDERSPRDDGDAPASHDGRSGGHG